MINARYQESSTLLINEAACINIRGRVKTCAACRDACRWDALSLSLEGIRLDVAQCTACGACVPSCPVGAMQLREFSPQGFLTSLDRQPTVHIHCSASCDSEKGVAIPCHSVLDARLLAAAYAMATVSFYLHGLDQCGRCAKGNATAQVSLMQQTLRTWFEQQAPDVISASGNMEEEKRETWRQDQSIRSRRGFLHGAGMWATAGAVAWLLPSGNAHDNESEVSPSFRVDLEQKRPAAYQALLLEHVSDLPWRQLPWWKRNITKACTACLVCAQLCPTGALDAWSKPATRGVDFELGLCTSCGLCERLCPEQAIEKGEARSVDDIVVGRIPLVTRPVHACSACLRAYVPDVDASELCHTCKKERELNEEWLGFVRKA